MKHTEKKESTDRGQQNHVSGCERRMWLVSFLLRSAWAEREARLCAWNPIIILSPRVSKYIMQGQSGILLGKEAGNILPPSLLVLTHSFRGHCRL